MGAGLIGGMGRMPQGTKRLFKDYAISLQMQTDGVDNWQPYSTAGTNCYVYDYQPLVDFPNSGFTKDSVCELLPRGTITQTNIENFAWINALEAIELTVNDTEKEVVRIYSFRGKPNVDINATLRIWKEDI